MTKRSLFGRRHRLGCWPALWSKAPQEDVKAQSHSEATSHYIRRTNLNCHTDLAHNVMKKQYDEGERDF